MEDMLNNLLMMRNHGQAQLAGVNAPPTLLDEIRDMAVADLSEIFSSILERTAGELLDLASRNPSHVMYCLYMDTRDQVQNQKDTLVSGFKRRMFQRFNEARRRGQLVNEARSQLDESQLNLVEPEELELTLASSTISHALRISCAEELPGLDRRMGLLLEDAELRFGPNPMGPDVIGDTLMDAIKALPAGNKVKLMLVTRLNIYLPNRINELYGHINQTLVSKGILPSIKLEVRRGQVGSQENTAPTASGTTNLNGPEAPTPSTGGKGGTAPGGDMFSMLQQLMSMGRIGGGAGTGGSGAGAVPLPGAGSLEAANEGNIDTGQVMVRLTRIQQGESIDVPGVALDPGIITNGQVNVLRAIKNTGAAGNMNHMDAMTLDIVALMFDYILDDHRLPDGMKALIGRLQIPVLKVAMLDKAFFSQKSHPARKLLDALADAALGWNEDEGHDSPLYKTVDGLVQRVLNDFEDNVEVFSDVLQELQSFVAEEKRNADERACHSAQTLQSNEQAALAHTIALESVQARLLDSEAPEFIHLFLLGPWSTYLADLYLKGGVDGASWNEGLTTMEELLWSLTPKTSKEDKQKLVALLPRLLKRIDEGIRATGQEREERDRFFANLVKFHAVAVKADPQASVNTVSLQQVRAAMGPITPSVPYVFDSPDFHDVPTASENQATDPRLLREISAAPEAEEILIGDVIGQDRLESDRPGEDGYFEKQVKQLKRGTWLEFTLENGSSLRAKLAWVSPLRGTYLFTNRLGERAVSINAAGLAAKLKDGSASIVDSAALIDRAVNSLFERLQKTS